MCGRYFFSELVGIRGISASLYDMVRSIEPDSDCCEICPGNDAPVYTGGADAVKLSKMKWGFSAGNGKQIINARCESLHERRMFSGICDSNRCVIPGSGYYEWRRGDGQQFSFSPFAGKGLFYLAGLYRFEDEAMHFTVLTRSPTAEVMKVHDRMPLVLPDRESALKWLGGADALSLCDDRLKMRIRAVGDEQIRMQI